MKFGLSETDKFVPTLQRLSKPFPVAVYLSEDFDQIELVNFESLSLFREFYLHKIIICRKRK